MEATKPSKDIQEKFLDLACQRSPENLTCDGEASEGHVASESARISREWKALESRVGRPVSENEVWSW